MREFTFAPEDPKPPPASYLLGLDLGQASDYTAIAVLEKTHDEPARYDCRHLERMKIGTPYPAVAAHVGEMLQSPALRGRTTLVVDNTGVGRPVVDMLNRDGLQPRPITITGGDAVTRDGPGHRVPKRDLVAVVQVLLQTSRIRFARDMPMVPTLVKELQDFRVKINTLTAHDSYGAWREGTHDDLVLAVAVAVWYGERAQSKPWALSL